MAGAEKLCLLCLHISIRIAVPLDLSFTVFPAVESDGLLQLVALGNDRKRKRGGERGGKRERNDKQSHSARKSLHSFIQLSTKSRLEVLIFCNQNKERRRGFGVCTDKVKNVSFLWGITEAGPPLFCHKLSLDYHAQASWPLVTHVISKIDRFSTGQALVSFMFRSLTEIINLLDCFP